MYYVQPISNKQLIAFSSTVLAHMADQITIIDRLYAFISFLVAIKKSQSGLGIFIIFGIGRKT
jgi:hypothetical protein